MKILLAVDDDATSYEAALVVAEWFPDDASVVALHVGDILPPPATAAAPITAGGVGYPLLALPALRTHPDQIHREAREVAAHAASITDGVARTEHGDPATTIIRVANEIDADLIAIGTGDRSWLSRLVDPSVSSDVTQNAPCSVLVVRPGAADTVE